MTEKKLSKNQKLFIQDAENEGLEVDMYYSGRGMYGKTCPSVYTDEPHFYTRAKYLIDQMGKGYVLYARS